MRLIQTAFKRGFSGQGQDAAAAWREVYSEAIGCDKRLTRRSVCQSKEVNLHDAQIDLLTGVYNFVDENQAFRQCINPNAKRFEIKYKKYSPAMLEGFTDHCLTLEALPMWRAPK
ncbi:hypothetical protein [Candidatus Entotheonella palauensis]|uniref:Uncharacterized protein n=1 Tax=Candidatus Entotheonella gemina TaxID=1429439 RepID=W4MD07_9BACT|nr:hypothetical protein [Candidatus Entotheonella palauensis]ETX07786.1 MAG: hypothetical protein ETSY2_09135 [Candidatus Entotheonella gemina]